jgi:CxxC-x17-CxxC domain-containing protein
MAFQDKTLTCLDCQQPFAYTAEEQSYHAERGYTEPRRCPSCRAARRESRDGGGYASYQPKREMFPAVCARCGKETEVPFRPSGDRPVYCGDCYQQRSDRGFSGR